uniref:Transcription factor n=1 Tax=Opuntia streptacantha TaxID=393608 RepID=A0A7C9EC98_OPUST
MPHLEQALEWVRPLIYVSNTWDYCVLWKLGDDPSRFIEFVGCCCSGGGLQQMAIKKVKRQQNMSIPLCRDAFHIHPANTKACEALARLPPSLPLYPGLHGEVVISSQPKWLNVARKSDSSTSDENCLQTRVLVPVLGGLIELFSTNNIPEDQRTIEVVKAQFAIFPETETMSTSTISFDGHSMNPSPNQAGILPSMQTLPVAHQYSCPNFDRSSTSSFPSDEHTSPDSNPCSVSQNQHQLNLCSPHHKDDATERQHCKSKNLFTERRRRNRINTGILRLRALVPKITKVKHSFALSLMISSSSGLFHNVLTSAYV